MMRMKSTGAISALALSFFMSGCSTLALGLARPTVIGSTSRQPEIAIGEVTVDKPSGGKSVEREIRRVLPSMLEDAGFILAEGARDASSVDILVVEREYISGASSVRSLMVEIAFTENNADAPSAKPSVISRMAVNGDITSASSRDLFRMVSATIKALRKKGFNTSAGKTQK